MEPVKLNNMASSLNVRTPDRAQNVRPNENQPDRAQETKRAQEAAKASQSPQEISSAAKGVYGDVLDISEDGDTVSARPEAMQALDDGYVIFKGEDSAANEPSRSQEVLKEIREEQEKRAEERAELRKEQQAEDEQQEEAEDAVNQSLTGYSDDMIDTLYRQGKIDSGDYNAEVDRRERRDEMTAPDEDPSQERIDRLNTNIRQMSELDATARQDELENDAYDNAVESDRVDLIKDIFNNQSQT